MGSEMCIRDRSCGWVGFNQTRSSAQHPMLDTTGLYQPCIFCRQISNRPATEQQLALLLLPQVSAEMLQSQIPEDRYPSHVGCRRWNRSRQRQNASMDRPPPYFSSLALSFIFLAFPSSPSHRGAWELDSLPQVAVSAMEPPRHAISVATHNTGVVWFVSGYPHPERGKILTHHSGTRSHLLTVL